MNTLTQLFESDLFAVGGRRKVYFHPTDPEKAIKITITKDRLRRKQTTKWYKKHRPLHHFDENHTDLHAYREIQKRGDDIYKHVPRLYGMNETPLGQGLVVELIRNESDAEPVMSLESWINQHGVSEDLINAFNELLDFLLAHQLLTRVVRGFNTVVRKMADGSLRIYVIDGFGTAVWLPFFNKITPLVRLKIQRQNWRAFEYLKRDFSISFADLSNS